MKYYVNKNTFKSKKKIKESFIYFRIDWSFGRNINNNVRYIYLLSPNRHFKINKKLTAHVEFLLLKDRK
jgi:hypothetical protein